MNLAYIEKFLLAVPLLELIIEIFRKFAL